jgi:MFS family permease
MPRRAIIALGIGQCVNWGVLYYAFAVLLLPVEGDLAASRWMVTGAFSLALLIAAALAPTVGRWTDRGYGAVVMQAGGFGGAALLALWALVPSVPTLYGVWAGLGVCMAATLYEPAFAIIGRLRVRTTERLRALATVTVLGGLASTVFLPTTAVLVQAFGWRASVGVLATILATSTYFNGRLALRDLTAEWEPDSLEATVSSAGQEAPAVFPTFLGGFALVSLASAAFTTNVIPALTERDVSPATAAMVGSLVGVMQLPGRALLMQGASPSPLRLVLISTALQSVGLIAFATSRSVLVAAGAVAAFAMGGGLMTLVRPHLVQTLFAIEHVGYLNGRLARWQQLARAAGPVAAASAASAVGYAAVFALLGSVLVVFALVTHRVLGASFASIAVHRRQNGRQTDATITES